MEDVINKHLCNFCINNNKKECLCYIEITENKVITKTCYNYKLNNDIKLEKYEGY